MGKDAAVCRQAGGYFGNSAIADGDKCYVEARAPAGECARIDGGDFGVRGECFEKVGGDIAGADNSHLKAGKGGVRHIGGVKKQKLRF